jgi:tRNA threonylcarbamoyladenosine biosynthesis protein TsaE
MLNDRRNMTDSLPVLSFQSAEPQTLQLPTAEATRKFGVSLGRSLPPGSILLLNGDLGSGKTTLVQGIGVGLDIAEPIVSPTFTLINEYLNSRIPLYHFDLYRLEPTEVAALHLETYWDGQETPLGIVAIEWPARLPYLPANYLNILLTDAADGGRLVRWEAV